MLREHRGRKVHTVAMKRTSDKSLKATAKRPARQRASLIFSAQLPILQSKFLEFSQTQELTNP